MFMKPSALHKDTKNTIFTTAARLFAEKGYNGVSMRELSERSGVSKPTIYYYFGSKEGIYTALLNEGIRHCTMHFKDIQARPIPSREKLALIVKALFEDALQYPDVTKFFLNLFILSDNMTFLRAYRTEAAGHTHVITEIVKRGIRIGELAPGTDPVLVADMLVGAVAHLIWHQTKIRKPILTNHMAEKIVNVIFAGIDKRNTPGGTHAS